MKAIISNNITVTKTKEIKEYCEKNLVMNNPDFIKKQKMGFWYKDTPKKLHLYEERNNSYILPFGEIKNIWKYIKDFDITYDFSNEKIYIAAVKKLELYDYQQKAENEMLRTKNGVLISPAGSGKTNIAIHLIKTLSIKTLWITHTKDLLLQSKERFETFYKCNVGTITEGKVEIGDITFATVQTMSKLDLKSIENEFSLVIVDECHRVCSSPSKLTMFGKVINSLKARYKIGLTATAHRSDGLIRTMFAYLGDIIHEVPATATESKTMKANIQTVYTDFQISPFSDCVDTSGVINFTKLITEVCEDRDRNDLIVSEIIKNRNMSCLVLSHRLSQLEYIKNKLGYGVMVSGRMTSKTGKKEREKAIGDMQNGKEKLLLASYNLAKEGLDIPCLERLFLAAPAKDYAVIVQSVGRIERKCEKKEPVVIDFVDKIGIALSMYKKRKAIYKKNNNKLI